LKERGVCVSRVRVRGSEDRTEVSSSWYGELVDVRRSGSSVAEAWRALVVGVLECEDEGAFIMGDAMVVRLETVLPLSSMTQM
jgi:hypothetical protein